jgi:hypothetical protein
MSQQPYQPRLDEPVQETLTGEARFHGEALAEQAARDAAPDAHPEGMATARDIGADCVHCGRDTSPGSGLYVNRIPADTYDEDAGEYVAGFMCPECLAEAEGLADGVQVAYVVRVHGERHFESLDYFAAEREAQHLATIYPSGAVSLVEVSA